MSTYRERVDLPYYREHVAGFLPDRVIDFHTHVYLSEHLGPRPAPRNWAEYVSPRSWSLASLRRYYERVFPGKQIVPVIFGMPLDDPDVDAANRYTAEVAPGNAYPFLLTRPQWSANELERRTRQGGFLGIKPYPTLAPKSEASVGVFDYLPHAHLEVAQQMGLCVILHLPRAGRLADPANVAELHEIDRRYPRLKLVVAHVGRAYCLPTAERGLAALRDCPGIRYDISANVNADVFALALHEVGPERLIFGTDLPAIAFRARRICEGDNYVNLVRRTGFTDSHLRPAAAGEADGITFFVYEQIAAFRRAAESVGLDRTAIEAVFRTNAEALLRV
ncbi:MAG: amidohydrolase family protein [Anaerolineae bacterium]